MRKNFLGCLLLIALVLAATATADSDRREWPGMVGMDGEEAAKQIKSEVPRFHVYVIPPNVAVTMDYRTNRVRVFVDEDGKVKRTPRVG